MGEQTAQSIKSQVVQGHTLIGRGLRILLPLG